MRIAFVILVTVIISLRGNAQGYETVNPEKVFTEFSEVAKVYGKADYSLSYQRTIYKNIGDTEAMLIEKGTIYRGKENEYRVESPGGLTIQNNELKIVVDSAFSLISIFKTDTLFQTIDVRQFMDKSITDKYTFQRLQNKDVIRYLMTPKSSLEGATELWINAKDYTLIRLEMLMPKSNYFSDRMDDQSMESPKLIITYNKPQPLKANKASFFDFGQIVENKNNQWTLMPNVKGFTLHDSRVITK